MHHWVCSSVIKPATSYNTMWSFTLFSFNACAVLTDTFLIYHPTRARLHTSSWFMTNQYIPFKISQRSDTCMEITSNPLPVRLHPAGSEKNREHGERNATSRERETSLFLWESLLSSINYVDLGDSVCVCRHQPINQQDWLLSEWCWIFSSSLWQSSNIAIQLISK